MACTERMMATNSGSVRMGAGAAAFDPPNQKHAAISAINAKALMRLVACCTVLLDRSPLHCKIPKIAMTNAPIMVSRPASEGTKETRYSPNAIEA